MKEEKDIKPDVSSISNMDIPSDVPCLVEIKQELISEPNLPNESSTQPFEKFEDPGFERLDIPIKSEVDDVEFVGTDDDIKEEPLESDELHIKNEGEDPLANQITEMIVPCKNNSSKMKIFQCGICNYKSKRKCSVRYHIRTHTRERRFKCTICDYGCMWNSHLQDHLNTHTGEKPLQCNICDYKCIQKSRLTQHIKTHTGEKPFECNSCGYKCIQKSNLHRHLRSHTGDKPFNCSICEYKCSNKRDLQRHTNTHTGVKPFKCTICEYRCAQQGHLKRHIQTHIRKKESIKT